MYAAGGACSKARMQARIRVALDPARGGFVADGALLPGAHAAVGRLVAAPRAPASARNSIHGMAGKDVGARVHAQLERFYAGGGAADEHPLAAGLRAALAPHVRGPAALPERAVAAPALGFATSVDLVAHAGGRALVVEYKTGYLATFDTASAGRGRAAGARAAPPPPPRPRPPPRRGGGGRGRPPPPWPPRASTARRAGARPRRRSSARWRSPRRTACRSSTSRSSSRARGPSARACARRCARSRWPRPRTARWPTRSRAAWRATRAMDDEPVARHRNAPAEAPPEAPDEDEDGAPGRLEEDAARGACANCGQRAARWNRDGSGTVCTRCGATVLVSRVLITFEDIVRTHGEVSRDPVPVPPPFDVEDEIVLIFSERVRAAVHDKMRARITRESRNRARWSFDVAGVPPIRRRLGLAAPPETPPVPS